MRTAMMWLPLLVATLVSASANTVPASADNTANTDVARATTTFTLDIMKSVLKTEKNNVIMSPLSVSTLLAMVQQGAKNNSVVQLSNVLHLTPESSKNFGKIIQNFTKRKYKSKLEFSNKIFANQDFDLQPRFLSTLHTQFDAGAETLNFRDSVGSAERINEWVSYSSKGRIPQLVKAESISGRTQLVIANVIYFKGKWWKTFEPSQTVQTDFHVTDKKKVPVPMMNNYDLFKSGEDKKLNALWVELPFDGDDFSMVLVLPTVRHGLAQVVEKMTVTDLNNMLNTRITKEVRVKLPRFKLNTDVPMVPALQKLGLVDIFDQRSNLEGISTSKGPLVVSDIIHKAEIEVNEEGSEASAASGIIVNTLSLQPEYEKVEFIADQPFLAFIVDKVNDNMPLFVARVSNPLTN